VTETPEAPAESQESQETESEAQPEQDTTDWKAEARKWQTRAKQWSTENKEYQKAKEASMSDAEKAIAEAETRGRTAAVTEYGSRLVRTEFDASAARRNPDFKTADVLEYVDLSRMVGEDGEPDKKAIADAVKRLIPEPQGSAPVNLNGGSRTPAEPARGFGDQLRREAGR
jgi:hypothetical protein